MFRAARLLQTVALLAGCTTLATATCYAPDGSKVTKGDAAPCSSDPSDPLSHVCCNINRPKAPGTSTNASEVRDTCLPNGLCENESRLKDGSVYYQWGRNFCTVRDWGTGQCLDNVCTNFGNDIGGAKRLVPCSGKNNSLTWCCGNSDDCCTSTNQADLVSLSPLFTTAAAAASTKSPASTPTSSGVEITPAVDATTGSLTSPSASPSGAPMLPGASPSSSTGLSQAAKAGIAIGSIVAAALLIVFGIWVSKALAWRRDAQAARTQRDPKSAADVEGFYGHDPQRYGYHVEVDATTPPVEASATLDPVEVPDNQVIRWNCKMGGLSAEKYG